MTVPEEWGTPLVGAVTLAKSMVPVSGDVTVRPLAGFVKATTKVQSPGAGDSTWLTAPDTDVVVGSAGVPPTISWLLAWPSVSPCGDTKYVEYSLLGPLRNALVTLSSGAPVGTSKDR
jgi:hypothetical protein